MLQLDTHNELRKNKMISLTKENKNDCMQMCDKVSLPGHVPVSHWPVILCVYRCVYSSNTQTVKLEWMLIITENDVFM